MNRIKLPEPQLQLEYQLMTSLKQRRTKRKMTHEELSLQDIANILWVACGETKKATKKSKNRRTIPSACNSQKVTVYAAIDSGVYRYDEEEHALYKTINLDVRSDLAKQPMLKNAPFGLIYVARNELKSGIIKHDETMQALLVGTEVGAMSQNVYLYSTSAGMNTVLIALYDRDRLTELLNLPDGQNIIYTQVIG